MDSEKRRKKPLKDGFLEKRGSFITSWRLRYFSLYEQRGGLLFYFLSKLDTYNGKILGIISLKRATVSLCDQFVQKKREFCIEIVSPEQGRTWYLSASSEQERNSWVEAISAVILGRSVVSSPKSPKVTAGRHRSFQNLSTWSLDTSLENILQNEEWVNKEIARTSSFSRGSLSQAKPNDSEVPSISTQRQNRLQFADPACLFVDLIQIAKSTYLGTEAATKRTVIIRIVTEHEGNKIDLAELLDFWAKYNHKTVINTTGCYKKNDDIWFVEEWYRLSLLDLNPKQFNGEIGELEAFVAYLCKEILSGLSYLHEMGTIHGRIQLDTIFIDPSGGGVVKFGKPLEAELGSLVEDNYQPDGDVTMPDDISALGSMIQDFLGPSLRWSFELTDFLDRCLVIDPYERPTAKMLLEDPFLKKCCKMDQFDKILVKFDGYSNKE